MACGERDSDEDRQAPGVNRLPRHEPPGTGEHDLPPAGGLKTRNGFVVSRGARSTTAETVRRSETEDSGVSGLPRDPAVPFHD